jgi:hypothetical protein
MRGLAALGFVAALLVAPLAFAKVDRAEPGAFLISNEAEVQVSAEKAWNALGQVERWWNPAHTYSRDASRLQLDLRAGSCFCERWGGGSVEHARVILAMTDADGTRILRLDGGLGPLQEIGAVAVLTFTIKPKSANVSTVSVEYHVAGDPVLGLDQAAGDVDVVISQQVTRLANYLNTGSPD